MFRNFLIYFAIACTSVWGTPEEELQQMSLEEKVGQLFIVGVYASPETAAVDGIEGYSVEQMEYFLNKRHIGGILFKRAWDPEHQFQKVKHFQGMSHHLLFCASDFEPGLEGHLMDVVRMPYGLALGAVKNDLLIYELGKEIGRQCELTGINLNFAPVVDVVTNRENPVIHTRSFGEDPDLVAIKGCALMRGLHEQDILACAKHFPGHGDTYVDSHDEVPVVDHPMDRLKKIELYPFKKMIEAGIKTVMVGHIAVSAIDPDWPATLSKKVITDLLREEMKFSGLVISDDMGMGAIHKNWSIGEACVRSLYAGCDLLVVSNGSEEGVKAVLLALNQGILREELIDQHVLRILRAKEWLVRNSPQPIEQVDWNRLHAARVKHLKKLLFHDAFQVHHLPRNTFPLSLSEGTVFLQLGGSGNPHLYRTLDAFRHFPHYYLSHHSTKSERIKLIEQLKGEHLILLPLYDLEDSPVNQWGVNEESIEFVKQLQKEGHTVILIIFGSPYVRTLFPAGTPAIIAYRPDRSIQQAIAHLMLTALRS